MKRVIIFIGNFSFGGAEVVGVNLANSFSSMGMKVSVFCLNDQGGLRKRLSPKVDVVALKTRLAFCFLGLRRFIMSLDEDTLFISTIRNLNIAVSLATIGSKPLCKFIYREANTYRNFLEQGIKGVLIWLSYALINNWAYGKARVLVANSNDTRTDLKSFLTTSLTKKIVVIGNPINTKSNLISNLNDELPLFNNRQFYPVLLSVGRLHPQKDYFLGLRAFRKLIEKFPDAKYVILGEGELLQDLKDFSASLGLMEGINVFFAGTTPNPERYYAVSDLFFMTSKWEGFGNVIVEAMGYGITPVVCKCPGGPRDIIGSEFGYYINTRNPDMVASSLEKALNGKICEDRLVKRAKQFSSNFIAEQYIATVKC